MILYVLRYNRFKESEEKRFTELRELRLQLEKEQIVNRQVEKVVDIGCL